MKNKHAYHIILFLLILSIHSSYAQESVQIPAGERISLFTDRTMYIAGEKIMFSAFLRSDGQKDFILQSGILYVELITPEGYRVSGSKATLDNGRASGCISIPEITTTGTFYLKAYTKFMRNEGPSSYHFSQIMIINPAKQDVLPARDEDTAIYHSYEPKNNFSSDKLRILIDHKVYRKREKVIANIRANLSDGDPSGFLCMTVAPAYSISRPCQIASVSNNSGGLELFYPEVRGISLTGRLQDKDSGKPLPGKRVNLSIIGDKDMMAIQTDSAGRFYFSLAAHTGTRDIFMCAENLPGTNPLILIDNDFCPKALSLPAPPFRLSEEEQKTAYSLAMNYRVSCIFQNDTAPQMADQRISELSFYGQPTEVIVLDKYIELPTLEEYFNELPTEVKVRKKEGRKHFRFYSTQAEMVIFDPLVLIDWVAVDDIERVLALSPAAISRIELVNAPYIKGNIMYGGIISFISKASDFAGVDLPASGTFVNYSFLSECNGLIPDKEIPASIPDARNTLYWNPDVGINLDGKETITFTAPDSPGKYMVLLHGVNQSGQEYHAYEWLEVY